MANSSHTGVRQRVAKLSRRERQCLDVLFKRGQATVAEVQEALSDPPGYSAVRATLNVLVDKGHAQHKEDGPRYVYLPAIPAGSARNAAVQHLVDTFFGGSPARAVATLLELPEGSDEELTIKDLRKAVLAARKQGR